MVNLVQDQVVKDKQTKSCLFMTGSQHFSPGNIQFVTGVNVSTPGTLIVFNCCRKTAVCNGDQLLDFSVPELVRSQSTFTGSPSELRCFHIVQFSGLLIQDSGGSAETDDPTSPAK